MNLWRPESDRACAVGALALRRQRPARILRRWTIVAAAADQTVVAVAQERLPWEASYPNAVESPYLLTCTRM